MVLMVRLASGANVTALFFGGRLVAPTGYINSTAALFTMDALVCIVLASRRAPARPAARAARRLRRRLAAAGHDRPEPRLAVHAAAHRAGGDRDRPRPPARGRGGRDPGDRRRSSRCAGCCTSTRAGHRTPCARWPSTPAAPRWRCASAPSCSGTLVAWADSPVSRARPGADAAPRLGSVLALIGVARRARRRPGGEQGPPLPVHLPPVARVRPRGGRLRQLALHRRRQRALRLLARRAARLRAPSDRRPGPGQLRRLLPDPAPARGEEPSWTHSLELRLLAHTGIVGFLLFGGFLGRRASRPRRATRRHGDADARLIAAALAAAARRVADPRIPGLVLGGARAQRARAGVPGRRRGSGHGIGYRPGRRRSPASLQGLWCRLSLGAGGIRGASGIRGAGGVRGAGGRPARSPPGPAAGRACPPRWRSPPASSSSPA